MTTKVTQTPAEACALFESMTPAQRRVAIAEEALLQIQHPGGLWSVETGAYLVFVDPLVGKYSDEVMSLVEAQKPRCKMCARGALFLAAILKFDRFPMRKLALPEDQGAVDHVDSGRIEGLEGEFFDRWQIALIETVFEAYCYSWNAGVLSAIKKYAAISYGRSIVDPTLRLIVILRNIIENDGELVLPEEHLRRGSQLVYGE